MECLSKCLFALLLLRDINLSKIATGCAGMAQVASHYKRLQRFLKGFEFEAQSLYQFIIRFFSLPDQLILTLDRTNWKFGKTDINILTLAIAYKSLAIPFLWTFLSSRGNSNALERAALLKTFLSWGATNTVFTLLADREFIGKDWLQFLLKEKIHFVIRTRENICAANARGALLPLNTMLRGIKPGRVVIFPSRRKIMGVELYIVALRMPTGELLILLTPERPQDALELYATRWNIEMLFSALKQRGFCFENTHVTQHKRLGNMVFILTLALCIALKKGEILENEKPAPLKKHGYVAVGLFKRGLNSIAHLIANLAFAWVEIKIALRKIFQPPKPLNLNQYLAFTLGVL
jgi:hypothetical protein